MPLKSDMDVIVKWRDGSKNCVPIKDLKCLRKGEKVNCVGTKVKMYYNKKWYHGVVIMTERDIQTESKNNEYVECEGSSDDEPLSIVKDKQMAVENEEKDPYCDIDLEDPQDPDYVPDIEPKRQRRTMRLQDLPCEPDLGCVTVLTKESVHCQPEQHCEVIGCCSEVFSSCHRCFILICWDHFVNDLSCEQHGELIPQNFTHLKLFNKEHKHADNSIHTSEELQINGLSSETQTQNQLCEAAGCNKEVNSSCFRCRLLLCWDHFSDVNCDDHRQLLSPSILQPIDGTECVISSNTQVFPEHFEVEGSPREIERTKTKKTDIRKLNQFKKNTGKQYTTQVLKKIVPERKIGPSCQIFNCKRSCYRFSDEIRENIFQSYWDQGNLQSQREFIVRHVKKEPVKRQTAGPESRRQATLQYFFPFQNQSLQVCQMFFLNTLGISFRTVRTSLKKVTVTGTIEKDKRGGRRESLIENDSIIRKMIEQHIERFPKVESHYCRENSSREYLHCDLTLPKMYHMFKEENKNCSVMPSFSSYRRVFKSKNLSFHRPKKDQCSLCMTYLKGSEEEKLKICEKYTKHQQEKTLFRSERNKCKIASQQNPATIQCATFDLQQVISLPISNENAVFYKRRLSAYNFTIYDMTSGACSCYTWHEGASKRGSSEISTSLYDFLKMSDARDIKIVYLFADGCSGQNKNSIVASTLLYVINNTTNIQEITLRFSVPCHGQNEGDSVHSTIGHALKTCGDIFVPSQLPPIFRLARRNKPYVVKVLTYTDFLDFKKLSADLRILSIREDDEGRCLNWTEMMEFSVKKTEPEKIFFKNSHGEEIPRSLSLRRQVSVFLREEIGLLNPTPPKISIEKYNDLLSLTTGDTPVIKLPEHVAFYTSLSH